VRRGLPFISCGNRRTKSAFNKANGVPAKKLTNFFHLPIEKYAEICYNINGKIWEPKNAEKAG